MILARRASSFLEESGPQSTDALGQWDTAYVERIMEESTYSSVLMQNMGRGWLVSSDFSGYDAPKECCRILVRALRQHVQNDTRVKDIRFVRACDMGEDQKHCLKMQSSLHDAGASCVFSNLLDRLPQMHREWISEAGPTKEMDIDEARKANQVIEQFVSRQGASMFPHHATCYCELHRQRCPAFPAAVLEKKAGQIQGASTVQDASSCKSPPRSSTRPGTGTPWHEEVTCFDDNVEKPITCSIAGLVCTDWSPLGQRKGRLGAGLTQPAHAVWVAERAQLAKAHLEDWYFSENSSLYPVAEKQVEALSSTHEVKYIVTGPEMLGFLMNICRATCNTSHV